ncbi:hypothetical protein CEUSTIGMA_g13927.t1 [Chlamydomonas eustigma]|uniref:N-acetyltransferase domain-containing protein n=1 Tax=Chlamydomonas eustigma TaxID=1157962 RepID=A0A250XUK2_9CHLO|nr:hypothetical protein CEUSTIGMA_g13927.t1 [Chlamydomonas eustigma]|eukprot:GAX86520.1 hypothetical protein CEUSTIGMA_g13927.t1 [Chlamydomonas eustigma]
MSTAQGERRLHLMETRSLLNRIPLYELFELPGRPHVVYQMRSYASTGDAEAAAASARTDLPFLFKAFETGQIGPKKLAKMHGGAPRIATIHEYLDWTLTAQPADKDDELDFAGFRVLLILPRYVPQWPPVGYAGCKEGVNSTTLPGPMPPLPILQTHGKPVCAATIRSGPGYLEIPFVATHEGKRGRGYCRCLLEAIEAICKVLNLRKLMLCSTNELNVRNTWLHLGFSITSEEEMEHLFNIPHSDLVYLQNTVQMYKDLTFEERRWKPVVIKHGTFQMRTYARIGEGRPTLPPGLPPSKKQAVKGLGGWGSGTMSGALPSMSNATSFGGGGGGDVSQSCLSMSEVSSGLDRRDISSLPGSES